MTDYQNDEHFVDRNEVTEVGEEATVAEVLAAIATKPSAAIVVLQGSLPQYFLGGRDLARNVVAASGYDPDVYAAKIREFLPGGPRYLSVVPVSYRVAGGVPEERISLGADADDAWNLYRVVSGDQLIGYLFNHEGFKGAGVTPPPKYFCELGHENATPNKGRCRSCPRRIVRQE